MNNYLNRKELAKYLKVNPCTIHRYREMGMPYIKLITGRIVYDPAEVEKWLLGGK